VADTNDLTEIIAAEAALPAKSAGDTHSAEGQPLPDLIEADKYLSAKSGTSGRKSAWRSVVTARGIPPGTSGS
jgi:hypothetical protein